MDMILKNNFSLASSAYEPIGEVTVETNTTVVDISGFSVGKDDELLLVSEMIKSGIDTGYEITINGNNTRTNYYYQELNARATTISSGRNNNPMFLYMATANPRAFCVTRIKLLNSRHFVAQTSTIGLFGSASVEDNIVATSSAFYSDSITSIRITATQTNAIAVGTKFKLYRLKAEKVADIIVPSNTTQVDITGLNIGKDGEYMLVAEVVNGTNPCNFALLYNDVLSSANYYTQKVTVNGSSQSAARSTNSLVGEVSISRTAMFRTVFKLANSGYFIGRSSGILDIRSSGMQMKEFSFASTTTATSISSLQIKADVFEGIIANSRFQLYKLK